MKQPCRRDWLRFVGSIGTASVAGCSGGSEESDADSDDAADEDPADPTAETATGGRETPSVDGRQLGETVEFNSKYRVTASDYATFTDVTAADPYNPDDPSTFETHTVADGYVYLAVEFSVTNIFTDGTDMPTDFDITYEPGEARQAYQLAERHWETDAGTVYHSFTGRYQDNGGDLGCCGYEKTITGWAFFRVPEGFEPTETRVGVLVWSRSDDSELLEWTLAR